VLAVLPRWEGGDDGRKKVIRQVEVAIALVFLDGPAHPDCSTVLIEVTDLGCFQLTDAAAALIERGRATRTGAAATPKPSIGSFVSNRSV
jgi:hypothetical protein